MSRTFALRGTVLHCIGAPDARAPQVERIANGRIVVRDGRIERVDSGAAAVTDMPEYDYGDCLLVPGFVDVHTHYPQTAMIAAYGEQLLDWLERHTFPTEMEFDDSVHAAAVADLFLDQLIANGTTTAMVYGTVHPGSVDALMQRARLRDIQILAGKVMMDRNCPEPLRDTSDSAYRDSKALIARWHGCGRLRYVVTPRFAPTSTDAQLAAAAALLDEYPGVHLQTHVAENTGEVRWVAELFPAARSYLDVYARAGLLRERTVLGHCIHLDDADFAAAAASGAAMAFCPSSNLFLGSGLFDLERATATGQRIGVGTDVGAGTSFSVLRTLGEAYKVAQLQGQLLTPARMLYLATLGGAAALHLDDDVGSFEPGKVADVTVLDPSATALTRARTARSDDPLDHLFALAILGDDRHVRATYAAGRQLRGVAHGSADE